MITVFISQPMRDLSEEEIWTERLRIMGDIEFEFEIDKCEIEFLESYLKEFPHCEVKESSVWYLGKSITLMSEADIVVFAGDWKNARGCLIERKIAEEYGLTIMEIE